MLNQRGQMSIFVVLIFNVLFVLFSMSINVGLVVHDKINLQNAVDLGAYYAAAKQAEMLNAIAHQNYQIRQAYKLLAWRYNVLGGVGTQAGKTYKQASRSTHEQPTVSCVLNGNLWRSTPGLFTSEDDVCSKHRRYKIIPPLKFGESLKRAVNLAPFNLIQHILLKRSMEQLKHAQETCLQYSAMNWMFNRVILTSYRWQQAQRRALIQDLATNMQRPMQQSSGFVDLEGGSVYQGVENTILRNLTHANKASGPQIEIYNSLQEGVRGVQQWLQPIVAQFYTQYLRVDSQCGSKDSRSTSSLPDNRGLIQKLKLQDLHQFNAIDERNSSVASRWGMSLGVEKNPWVMVYVGVKATTKPRQLFWPLGPAVSMTARAFAKPFGGRVGPWYGSKWPQGASHSSARNARLETLFPAPWGGPPQPIYYTPRAPRYPGDTKGFKWQENMLGSFETPRLENFKASHLEYFSLADFENWHKKDVEMDALVWGPVSSRTPTSASYPRLGGLARVYELRAVAPDLFDVAYYSIEPNSWPTYQSKIKKNRALIGVRDTVPVLHDVGYRDPQLWSPAPNSLWSNKNFGVQDQIKIVQSYQANPVQKQNEYLISKWEHVLSNWLHPKVKDGRFDIGAHDFFASCRVPDSQRPQGVQTVPGACVVGGRSGYSVKLISRQQLRGRRFALGGDESEGPILNPPDDF